MNWPVKSVCVGSNNVPLSVDPYGGCPAKTTIRKIQVGEGLPYHNGGKPGAATQNYSFPIRDLAGHIFVLATHDFPPYNVFNLYDGTDGYAIDAVRGSNVTWTLVFLAGITSAQAGTICGHPEEWTLSEATQCDPVIIKQLEKDGFQLCHLFLNNAIYRVWVHDTKPCPYP